MFVGHYGPSFAGKALKKSIPLWVLFIAVQFLDVLWSLFVILGIEKVRIVPGITRTNPLDLYYMPYTHSLAGAMVWAVAAGIVYWLFRRADGWSGAAVISAAVFSHWILDLLVHRPDLPLYGDSLKIGLGLWNYPVLALAIELAFLFGGMYLYLRTTTAITTGGRYGMVAFGFVMICIQVVVFFGPPPNSDRAAAVTALTSYVFFAAVAYWLEKKRAPNTVEGSPSAHPSLRDEVVRM
ncbi:MAG TPA: hypothetical protein VMT32_15870 [Bryobacteraceae bacterium]|nr:hypothetical protein [Bryobacteraceae bacterium]